MSKIVASSLIALLGVAGYTLSDNSAIEIAGIVVTVGAQVAIYALRIMKPDVNSLGIKRN